MPGRFARTSMSLEIRKHTEIWRRVNKSTSRVCLFVCVCVVYAQMQPNRTQCDRACVCVGVEVRAAVCEKVRFNGSSMSPGPARHSPKKTGSWPHNHINNPRSCRDNYIT